MENLRGRRRILIYNSKTELRRAMYLDLTKDVFHGGK